MFSGSVVNPKFDKFAKFGNSARSAMRAVNINRGPVTTKIGAGDETWEWSPLGNRKSGSFKAKGHDKFGTTHSGTAASDQAFVFLQHLTKTTNDSPFVPIIGFG